MNKSQLLFKRAMLLSFAFLFLTVSFSTAQAAGEVDPTFNAAVQNVGGVNFVRRTAIQPDGKLIVVGQFTVAGNVGRSGVVRLNADGSIDRSFTPPDFYKTTNTGAFTLYDVPINSVAIQSDGKVLVGGDFVRVGLSTSAKGMVRLNTDGSLDSPFNYTYNPNNYSVVSQITVRNDGKILFTAGLASGAPLQLLQLNTDGSLDSTFSSGTSAITGMFVLLPDGKIIYPAGNSVRRILADGQLDGTFNLPSVNTSISTIAIQSDGKILIGGSFTTVNGFSKNQLARLNSDGTFDSTFNPSGIGSGSGSIGIIVLLPDGKIFIAGSFNAYNGVARSNKARLNNDGTLDTTINYTLLPALVDVKSLGDGRLIVLSGDGNTGNVSRYNADGSIDTSFLGPVYFYRKGVVYNVIALPDGRVLINGGFNRVNEINRPVFALLNTNGSVDNSFIINATAIGKITLQTDGKIILAGSFPQVGTTPANSLRRLNPDFSIDISFQPAGLSGILDEVAVQTDGKILVAGDVSISPSTIKYGVIRLNADGSVDSTFSKSLKTAVSGAVFPGIQTLKIQSNGKIVIGGQFTEINGVSRGRVARLNADGTLDMTFNATGANNDVVDLVIQSDGSIIIGGLFSVVNGVNNQYYLARLLSDGTLDTTFAHSANAYVYAIKRQADDRLIIGGNFNAVAGIPLSLARLNSNGTLDTSFTGSVANDVIRDIYIQNDGNILVGGDFSRLNNSYNVGIARLLNVAVATRTPFDFDGDGRADISVFRPSNGVWYLQQSTNGFTGSQFGAEGDKLAPADYDGDGKTDLAVVRSGVWYIQRSSLGFIGLQFGVADDIPVPADYDGDGKADVAVFRPSNGTWYLQQSTAGFAGIQLGVGTDKPVPGDYNGDGRAEVAVYRPSNGTWYLSTNPATGFGGVVFGTSTDILVPADYDGDGKTDLAVFRPSNGTWYIQRSTAGFIGVQFGLGTDIPVPADYDGDGKADIAVVRNGNWYLNRSTAGFTGIQFGYGDDKPIPNSFVR